MTTTSICVAPGKARGSAVSTAPRGELRLTRRGRVVVTAFLLVAVLAMLVRFSAQSAAVDEAVARPPMTTVVVEEGDTLWEIAATVAAPGGVREMVHRIQKINALPGPEIFEGQALAVPLL